MFKWDGKFPIPMEIWDRVEPIREAVLGTIEDLAPESNSYVFTNVLKDDEKDASQYDRIRSLAQRVRRIDNPDQIARLKGSDPEGYRRHRNHTKLYQPPVGESVHIDTTKVGARHNAERIYETLLSRGLRRPNA